MVAPRKSKQWTSAAAKRLLSLAGNPGTIEDAVQIVAGEAIRSIPHPPLQLDALAGRLNVTGITYRGNTIFRRIATIEWSIHDRLFRSPLLCSSPLYHRS